MSVPQVSLQTLYAPLLSLPRFPPFHSYWFYYPNHIWWGVKLRSYNLGDFLQSSFMCFFLGWNIFIGHPILQNPTLPYVWDQVSCTYVTRCRSEFCLLFLMFVSIHREGKILDRITVTLFPNLTFPFYIQLGGEGSGAWRWIPTPYSTEVKEIVELYLYSPSGPSWPVLGWNLLYTFKHSILNFVLLFTGIRNQPHPQRIY